MPTSVVRHRKPTPGPSNGPPARVVLVDDHPDRLHALEGALDGLEAELVAARSPDEALSRLLEPDCACVLLGMDGFETAKRIRARPATRHVPILIVTEADPDPADTSRAYALGAVDVLSRSVDPEALRAKVAFFVDVYRLSREARESRSRYDALSDIATVGIFHTDPDGDCLWVNARWCDITGLTPQQAEGQGWARALHPDDRDRVFDAWTVATQRDGLFRSEYRFVGADGAETWVLGQAKAERDAAGRVKGYVGTITDITDRRRAEKLTREANETLERQVAERTRELARSGEHHRLILEGSLDAVVTMNDRGLITGWNTQAERMFGWPEGEIFGKPLGDTLIPPRYREAHRRGMAHLRATGQGPILGRRVELYALRRDGSEFPIELAVTPLRSDEGTSFSAFIRDISERRQAENLSDRLAAVVRSSEDAIVTKTLDGQITSWNEGAERMFGYLGAEAVGRPITLLIPPELLDEERMILGKIARGERVVAYETVRVRKGGSKIDVSITVSPLKDHDGRIVGASKIARDITERKRSQERARFLAQAAELLAASLDYESTVLRVADFAARSPLSDWCSIVLKEGDTVRRAVVAHRDPAKVEWAREFEKRFPYDPTKDQIITRVLESGRPSLFTEIGDDLLRASARDEEHYRILKASDIRSAMVVPMSAGGRVIGAISLISAESRRQYTAEDLELALSLAERAAIAIENARLYRAAQEDIARRKAVEATLENRVLERTTLLSAAVRELEAFSYTVAHDLRAPIRAMSGLARILEEDHIGKTDEAGQEYARRIIESGKRMDAMVKDLLDYSRLARQEFRMEPVDLAGVVREVLTTLDADLVERGAQVTVREPLPEVLAHRGALVQAVTNLVQNAAKFVLPGTRPEIVISTEERRDTVVLWVEDHGIGIAPEHHDRIFGVFQRLHEDRRYPGTGIGLAIVRKAMERMEGRVGVDSALGKGSRFWLELRKGRGEA